MSRDEILALSGRELDAAVAEKVMRTSADLMQIGAYSEFSTDANAARLVLAEVERRGDEYALVRGLRVVEPSLPDVTLEYGEHQVWDVLKLTPKQLCHAALLAVEGV